MNLPRAPPIRITLITVNAAILSLVLYYYAATYMNDVMRESSLFGASILIAGLVMMLALGIWKRKQAQPTVKQSSSKLMWVAICLGAVFILNWSTTWKTLSSNAIGDVAYSQLMGVSEEIFFRGFLTSWLMALMGPMLGLLLGATTFGIFHFSRYGESTPDLLICGGAGLLLGYAMMETGDLDSSITAHALVNFVGLGGFLLGGIMGSMVAMAICGVLFLILLKPNRGGKIV